MNHKINFDIVYDFFISKLFTKTFAKSDDCIKYELGSKSYVVVTKLQYIRHVTQF